MNYGNVALFLGYPNTLGLLVTGVIKSCHWNQREWELFVKFLHESCFVVWQVYQHPYSSSEMRRGRDKNMTKSPKSSNCLDSMVYVSAKIKLDYSLLLVKFSNKLLA